MNLQVKKALQLISYQLQSGLSEDSLFQALSREFPQISISQKDILIHIEPYITRNKNMLIAKQDYIHHNIKLDKLHFFFFEDETLNIIKALYLIICKSGDKGIKYSDISSQYNRSNKNKKQLDIQMISHYCRKLSHAQFIQIQSYNNYKKAIANHFGQTFENKEEIDTKDECLHFEASNNIELAQKILENESFTFKELTFMQNFSYVLSSGEAYSKSGLSMQELSHRISKYGDKKRLAKVYFIRKILQDQQKLSSNNSGVQSLPNRQGKVFSYRYLNKTETMNAVFKVKKKSEEIQSNKMETILETVQKQMVYQSTNPILNIDCFQKIKFFFEQNSFLHFLKNLCFIEQDSKDYQKFIEECYFSDNQEHSKLGELMIRVLIEQIENKKEQSSMSKQSASRQKINRYIYIMNTMQESKIQACFLLRNMIIQKEKTLGIGKVDRKTLDPIFATLEKVHIIQQIYKEIDQPWFRSSGTNKKSNVILYYDVCPDDISIQKHIQQIEQIRRKDIPHTMDYSKMIKQETELDEQDFLKIEPNRPFNFNISVLRSSKFKNTQGAFEKSLEISGSTKWSQIDIVESKKELAIFSIETFNQKILQIFFKIQQRYLQKFRYKKQTFHYFSCLYDNSFDILVKKVLLKRNQFQPFDNKPQYSIIFQYNVDKSRQQENIFSDTYFNKEKYFPFLDEIPEKNKQGYYKKKGKPMSEYQKLNVFIKFLFYNPIICITLIKKKIPFKGRVLKVKYQTKFLKMLYYRKLIDFYQKDNYGFLQNISFETFIEHYQQKEFQILYIKTNSDLSYNIG